MSNQPSKLLLTRQFGPFMLTMVLNVLNDNIFKNSLIIMFAYQMLTLFSLDGHTIVNITAAMFILPYLLFSTIAGHVSEKYDKARVMRAVKFFEIVVMCLGFIGVVCQSGVFLIFVLFLMGLQSTMFSPAKYSALPQLVPLDRLILANAYVEFGTFVSIAVGTILGGVLISLSYHSPVITSGVTVVLAVCGYMASRYIPAVPSAHPHYEIKWNIITETVSLLKLVWRRQELFYLSLLTGWFWFGGMFIMSQVPNFTKHYLGGSSLVTTLILTCITVGIGLGSFIAVLFARLRLHLGATLILGMLVCVPMIDIYFAATTVYTTYDRTFSDVMMHPGNIRILIDFLVGSLFFGAFVVPLYAQLQKKSGDDIRSRIFAASNIIDAFMMVLANVYAVTCMKLGLTLPLTFALCGLLSVLAIFLMSMMQKDIRYYLVSLSKGSWLQ